MTNTKRKFAEISSATSVLDTLAPFHNKFTDEYVKSLIAGNIAWFREQADMDTEFAKKQSENDLLLIEFAQRTVVESINQEQLSQGILYSTEKSCDIKNEPELITQLKNMFTNISDDIVNKKISVLASYLSRAHDIVNSYLDMVEQYKYDRNALMEVVEQEDDNRPEVRILQANDVADLYAYQVHMHRWLRAHVSSLSEVKDALNFLSIRLKSESEDLPILNTLEEMKNDIENFSIMVNSNELLHFLKETYENPKLINFNPGYTYFKTLLKADSGVEFPTDSQALMNYKAMLQLYVQIHQCRPTFTQTSQASFWDSDPAVVLREKRYIKKCEMSEEMKRRRVEKENTRSSNQRNRLNEETTDIYSFIPENFQVIKAPA